MDVLQALRAKILEVVRKHPGVFDLGGDDSGQRGPPLISYDNDKIHLGADVQRVLGFARVPLPAHSHDMHKVIEHVHAYLKQAFKRALMALSPTAPRMQPEAYRSMLEEVFAKVVTADAVGKDVKSLRETYKRIVVLQGDYPEAQYR